jgi:hypothetical protein
VARAGAIRAAKKVARAAATKCHDKSEGAPTKAARLSGFASGEWSPPQS